MQSSQTELAEVHENDGLLRTLLAILDLQRDALDQAMDQASTSTSLVPSLQRHIQETCKLIDTQVGQESPPDLSLALQ